MKSEGWAPLWVDVDSKKCQIQMVQMTKNLTNTLSITYILYQPKGVPTPRDNFSGTGNLELYNSLLNVVPIVAAQDTTRDNDF